MGANHTQMLSVEPAREHACKACIGGHCKPYTRESRGIVTIRFFPQPHTIARLSAVIITLGVRLLLVF